MRNQFILPRSKRSRGPASAAGLAAIALLASACSAVGEKLAEEGAERVIESETGENVEIDFGGDGLSFETDEGSVRIDEDGNFVVIGEDGQVFTGEANDDGFTVEGEDGSAVFDVDGEGGDFSFETDDGEGASFSAGPGLPSEWPAMVPPPVGLTDVNHSVIIDESGSFISVSGTVQGNASEYFDSYDGMLQAANYTRVGYFEGSGARNGNYEAGNFMVFVTADEATSTFSVSTQMTLG